MLLSKSAYARHTRTREGEVLSTPPLQPSSSLFQIAVLVCPDAGVQIELSKVVTHRQRQWGIFGRTRSKLQLLHTVTILQVINEGVYVIGILLLIDA